MNTAETLSTAEAAYAIDSASSPALQALALIVPKEHIRMVWLLGYCRGRSDAFGDAQRWLGTPDKAVSTGPGDLDVCGRELRPGT